MRLLIEITLDSGGKIILRGENLSAEDVNEVFEMLRSKDVESAPSAQD